jgi:hypothetical protein
MPSRRLAIACLLALALALALNAGCGSDPAGPGDPSAPPPYPESGLGLLPADSSSFAAVWSRYGDLRGTQSAEAARATLLAELASWDNVAAARLATDGSSFTLEFDSGALALLLTAEDGRARQASPPPGAGRGPAAAPGAAALRAAPAAAEHEAPEREAIPCISCGSLLLPSTHRVHIVSSAGGSGAGARAQAIRQHFLDLGWAPELIELSIRDDAAVERFVPADLLDQEAYGLAVILGAGGALVEAGGEESFVLEGFRGGEYADGYAGLISPADWAQCEDWLAQEQMLMGAAWRAGATAPALGVWLRAELLASQLKVAPCEMVALLAGNSMGLVDLLADGGPGSFSGWDGPVAAADADAALAALVEGMLAGGGLADDEALDALLGEGLGTSEGPGGSISHFQVADIEGDYYLPGWGTVALDPADFPPGTVSVQVEFAWSACPDYTVSVTGAPGEEPAVGGLLPGEAQVTTTALDGAGNPFGFGYAEQPVAAGPNDFAAETCLADLDLAIGVYPDDPDHETSRIHVEIDYLHGPIIEYDMDPQQPIVPDELAPGVAIITTTAYSEDDSVRGRDRSYVSMQCGQLAHTEHCYGWVRIVLGQVPPGTEEILVRSATPEIADVVPLLMVPQTEGTMTGFTSHTTPIIRASAHDADGDELGHTDLPVTIACGEQTVTVDILGIGIALRASPPFPIADGLSQATFTATVRKWQWGDLVEPSGDTVEGVHVDFETDFGTWAGPAGGDSDDEGVVTAYLVSTESGTATVHAYVSETGSQSQPAQVTFVNNISVWVNGNSGAIEDDGLAGSFEISCAELRYYFNGGLLVERIIGAVPGGGGWGAYMPHWAEPGDVFRLEFSPRGDLEDCDQTETGYHPAVAAVWVHTAREPDFEHQGAFLLFGGADPLGGSASGSVTVQEIDYELLGKGGPASTPLRVSSHFEPDGRLIVEVTPAGERTLVWQPRTQRYE